MVKYPRYSPYFLHIVPMDNYKILLFLSMDKIDLAKYYIVIYFPNRPWKKKNYFNRLYCPMEGIDKSIR